MIEIEREIERDTLCEVGGICLDQVQHRCFLGEACLVKEDACDKR